jgi:hypothetical protein
VTIGVKYELTVTAEARVSVAFWPRVSVTSMTAVSAPVAASSPS